jgi:hypothetical protein
MTPHNASALPRVRRGTLAVMPFVSPVVYLATPRAVVSAIVCSLLFAWATWTRVPIEIYRVYLGVLLLLIFIWGLSFHRSFRRIAVGAFLGAAGATVVAFIGMLLPNAEVVRRCREPGMRCEDFSGVLLIYGAPFVLFGIPIVSIAVHAATLGIKRGMRHFAHAARDSKGGEI